jgi:hypothetical protein|tara:strand:+ start:102 stop:473 length:372 start_codon:yes stop_codon:yes gene_type:complete
VGVCLWGGGEEKRKAVSFCSKSIVPERQLWKNQAIHRDESGHDSMIFLRKMFRGISVRASPESVCHDGHDVVSAHPSGVTRPDARVPHESTKQVSVTWSHRVSNALVDVEFLVLKTPDGAVGR